MITGYVLISKNEICGQLLDSQVYEKLVTIYRSPSKGPEISISVFNKYLICELFLGIKWITFYSLIGEKEFLR